MCASMSPLPRIARYLLLRPQTLLLLGGSLAVWSFLEVKTILRSSRDAVSMMKGRVVEVMLHEEFSKTWQYKSSSAAVYSIQGRRDHMEDRFHILTDALNQSHTDIYGVFDGHGGEVNICLSVCACMRASVCLSVHACICLSVHACICLSVHACICLSVHASVCLSVHASVCLSVCACMHLSVCLVKVHFYNVLKSQVRT